MGNNVRMERVTAEGIIRDWIEKLTDTQLVDLNNAFCRDNYYDDDVIYCMADLDEYLIGTATEVIEKLDDDFTIEHRWFTISCDEWYKSINNFGLEDLPMDLDDLVQYVKEHTKLLPYAVQYEIEFI